MRRFLVTCAAVLSAAVPAAAAPGKDPQAAAAVAQVERFFAAMKAGDETTLKAILLPEVTFTAQRMKDGQASLRRISAAEWAASLAKGGPVVEERMWDPVVMRRGPIAMVWAPYELLVDGKSMHCGIDVFDLVEVEGTWRVAHLMWTQEPQACAELKRKG